MRSVKDCAIVSQATIIGTSILEKLAAMRQSMTFLLLVMGFTFGGIQILRFAPAAAEEKPLEKWEIKRYRIISIEIAAIEICIAVASYFIGRHRGRYGISVSVAFAFLIEGILLTISKTEKIQGRKKV